MQAASSSSAARRVLVLLVTQRVVAAAALSGALLSLANPAAIGASAAVHGTTQRDLRVRTYLDAARVTTRIQPQSGTRALASCVRTTLLSAQRSDVSLFWQDELRLREFCLCENKAYSASISIRPRACCTLRRQPWPTTPAGCGAAAVAALRSRAFLCLARAVVTRSHASAPVRTALRSKLTVGMRFFLAGDAAAVRARATRTAACSWGSQLQRVSSACECAPVEDGRCPTLRSLPLRHYCYEAPAARPSRCAVLRVREAGPWRGREAPAQPTAERRERGADAAVGGALRQHAGPSAPTLRHPAAAPSPRAPCAPPPSPALY